MDRAHGYPLVVKLKKGHNLLDNRPNLNIGFIFVFRSTVVHCTYLQYRIINKTYFQRSGVSVFFQLVRQPI